MSELGGGSGHGVGIIKVGMKLIRIYLLCPHLLFWPRHYVYKESGMSGRHEQQLLNELNELNVSNQVLLRRVP